MNKKKIKRIVYYSIAAIVAFYFAITSSFAMRLIFEPLLSYAFEFNVSADSLNINLLTMEAKVKGLKLGYPDRPFFTCKSGTFKLVNVFSFANYKYTFKDANIDGGVFHFISDRNKTTNFPWLEETTAPQPTKTDNKINKKASIDNYEQYIFVLAKNITAKNSKIVIDSWNHKKEKSFSIILDNLNLYTPCYGNGHNLDIVYNGLLHVKVNDKDRIKNADINGLIKTYSNTWFELSKKLFTTMSLKGATNLATKKNFSGHTLNLLADIIQNKHKYEIKKIYLKDTTASKIFSKVSVDGSVNTSFKKGVFNIKANPISPNIVDLLSDIFAKYDFLKTKVIYDGVLAYNQKDIVSKGKVSINNFDTIRKDKAHVELCNKLFDINIDYLLNYNFLNDAYTVENLYSYIDERNKVGKENRIKTLEYKLNNPLNFQIKDDKVKFIGKVAKGIVTVKNIDLHILNPFLIDLPKAIIRSGRATGTINLIANSTSNQFDLNGKINTKDLSAYFERFSFKNVDIDQNISGGIKNFNDVEINDFLLDIQSKGQKLFQTKVAGKIDIQQELANLNVSIPAMSSHFLSNILTKSLKNKTFANVFNTLAPFNLKSYNQITLDLDDRKGSINASKNSIYTNKQTELAINAPKIINFSWDSKRIKIENDPILNLTSDNLKLPLLNIFIPQDSKFKFLEGDMYSNIDLKLDRRFRELTIRGRGGVDNAGYDYDGIKRYFLNLSYNYGIKYDTATNNVYISNIDSFIAYYGNNILNASLSGLITPDNNTFKGDLQIHKLTNHALELLPNYKNRMVDTIELEGNVKLDYSKEQFSSDGLLNIMRFTRIDIFDKNKKTKNILDSGKLKFGYSKTKNLDTAYLEANMSSDNKNILNMNGFFKYKKNNNNRDNLEIKTITPLIDVVGITPIITAFAEVPSNSSKENKIEKSKPDKLELSDALNNLKVTIDSKFEQVLFAGKNKANISLKGEVVNNVFYTSPIISFINGHKLIPEISLNLKYQNALPYTIRCKAKDIPLMHLITLRDDQDANNTKGVIKSIDIDISGVNTPFSQKPFSSLKGKIDIDAKDIVTTYNLSNAKYSVFRLIFLPLQIFGNIIKSIPSGLTLNNVSTTVGETADLFSKLSIMTFETSTIRIKMNDDLAINKFELVGGETSPVSKISFNGKIYKDKSMILTSKSNIMGIYVPLLVEGSWDEPQTNIESFVYNFFKDNTFNILNPQNLVDIVSGIFEGIGNTIVNASKLVYDPKK